MEDLATWLAVIIGVLTLAVAYLAYKSQRGKTRLEFVVILNTSVVVFRPLSATLTVAHNGKEVTDASVVVLRLVNTGDKAILAESYTSALAICLDQVNEVIAATPTRTRPGDLNPQVTLDKQRVLIAPLLINPGDMIELQALTSGLASSVRIEGRIANLTAILQRRDLPYPPGSGGEGEMVGFDKFIWYVFMPGFVLGVALFSISFGTFTIAVKVISGLVAAILVFGIYPLQVRYLVQRRRMWKP
ncbi:MAG: hypothetical protein ACREBW_02870 [Candidatus Micrarchaeaceae archaeon]